jgi:Holliday junction DNA helicase RuvA
MIASLRGLVQEKSLQRVVIDVGGVGYLVNVSMQTLADLPAVGETTHLLCYTHVREDALQIFGFLAAEEQKVFELLIQVSGIGPKLALTILSGMAVTDILQAIINSDHRRLQSIPGIGKKTSERVIVELRDRCAKLDFSPASTSLENYGKPAVAAADVIEALVNLGYKRPAAEKVVERLMKEQVGGPYQGPEQLLRSALTAMSEL